MRKRYEEFYCHDATCQGSSGFDVGWNEADMTDPGEYDRDTCPYCGDYMFDLPLDKQEFISGIQIGLGIGEEGQHYLKNLLNLSDEKFNKLAKIILDELAS